MSNVLSMSSLPFWHLCMQEKDPLQIDPSEFTRVTDLREIEVKHPFLWMQKDIYVFSISVGTPQLVVAYLNGRTQMNL